MSREETDAVQVQMNYKAAHFAWNTDGSYPLDLILWMSYQWQIMQKLFQPEKQLIKYAYVSRRRSALFVISTQRSFEHRYANIVSLYVIYYELTI